MLTQKVPGSSSSRKLPLSIGSAVGPDDGGRQRSEQLRELGLLRNAELMSVDEPGDSADTRGDLFVAIRFGKAFFRMLPLLSMRGIVSALRQCGKMLGIVQRHSFERLLIEMGAGRNLLPAFFLSHLGLPIEVFPHNIEFLSLKPQMACSDLPPAPRKSNLTSTEEPTKFGPSATSILRSCKVWGFRTWKHSPITPPQKSAWSFMK